MSADILIFLAAGLLGGAVNVAAGGAKLFVFPMLLAAGLPPLSANVTGTVALWPAQLPGVLVFRSSLPASRRTLVLDALAAALGGAAGAGLLISLGEETFVRLVPLFLAIAVAAILFGDRLKALGPPAGARPRAPWIARGFFLLCGVYAGFFGAGLGFMLLATIILASGDAIHAANARKNLLAVTANTAAVLPLALSGLVHWPAAAAVLLGGLAGGYAGARVIRALPERPLKIAIAVLGTGLTLRFLLAG